MSQLPRYESYKDSGVQWLGEIPSHWDMTTLKFECDVRDGTHDTPEYVSFDENTYPLITSSRSSASFTRSHERIALAFLCERTNCPFLSS